MAAAPPPYVIEKPNSKLLVAPVALTNFARDAGFRDDTMRGNEDVNNAALRRLMSTHSELAVAVAIAYTESGRDRTAFNASNPTGTANGLWQIWVPGTHEPQQLLFDPGRNAAAAFAKYKAGNGGQNSFAAWANFGGSTWPARFTSNLAIADLSAQGTHHASVGERAGDVVNSIPGIGSVGDFLHAITSGALWLRVLLVITGLALAGVALMLILRDLGVNVAVPGIGSIGVKK